ncbi:STAS domain-containing protein [Candidatus Poriferisodalis sp.]|uniref:STAS domain-containing protein n=1 Tax=Candidatus Poriferisodalis sp. TaxID=3101277 RepID=UPI003B5180AB
MISGISERTVDAGDGSIAVVVTPRGELDLGAIASLDSAFRSALAAAGTPPKLIVDLSDADILAPVVVGVLLDARRRCRNGGGVMVLAATAPEVAAVLADTGIAPLFASATDVQAAIGQVSAASHCGS